MSRLEVIPLDNRRFQRHIPYTLDVLPKLIDALLCLLPRGSPWDVGLEHGEVRCADDVEAVDGLVEGCHLHFARGSRCRIGRFVDWTGCVGFDECFPFIVLGDIEFVVSESNGDLGCSSENFGPCGVQVGF